MPVTKMLSEHLGVRPKKISLIILYYPLLTPHMNILEGCAMIYFLYIKDIFVRYLCISYCFMQYPVIFSYLYIETSRFFYIQIDPA
jgi:hypothetical protein